MTTLAVTPRSFRQVPGPHQDLLEEHGLRPRYPSVERLLSEDEMTELVAGCDAVIVGLDPVTDAVLASGPLRLVVKYGSGLDNVDLDAARRRGVEVVSTPGMNSASVAELTLALMYALARHVVPHHRALVGGTRTRYLGIELAGRRLGLVGFGQVGRRVADLARGVGLRVVAHDPAIDDAPIELVTWDDVLRSDIVSIHVPWNEDTHHLIDAGAIAAMSPGALLVDTARPAIVDEAALADALERGHLGGAAFDDLGGDEAINARLLSSDRFIAAPHSGAATVEAAIRTGVAAVRAVLERQSARGVERA